MTHKNIAFLAALFTSALLALHPARVHAGHVYAGLTDSNGNSTLDANDALAFYNSNGPAATILSGLGPFSMTLQITGNQAGLYAVSSPTFTALARRSDVTDAGAPVTASQFAATSGSLIRLQIYEVTGPAGGTFSFWEGGSTTATYAYKIGTTAVGSLGNYNLTDVTSNVQVGGTTNGSNPPQDPFGHIHGRSFTADLPGTYTVSYVLSDAMNARQASTPFTASYTVVPEPGSLAALGAGGALLAALRFRRRLPRLS